MNTCLFRQEVHSYYYLLVVLDCHLVPYQPLSNSLRPSSLTHSLQIYYIWLTRPISHTLWEWVAKRVPTIGDICGENLCNSECNSEAWQDQVHTRQSHWGPSMAILLSTLIREVTMREVCIPHILIRVNLDYTGRIAKRGAALGAFDIKYMPCIFVKGQVLTDLVP